MRFAFLHLYLFSADEHVLHGEKCYRNKIIITIIAAGLICNFYLSVAACAIVLNRSIAEILKHVDWTLSKQQSNQQTMFFLAG